MVHVKAFFKSGVDLESQVLAWMQSLGGASSLVMIAAPGDESILGIAHDLSDAAVAQAQLDAAVLLANETAVTRGVLQRIAVALEDLAGLPPENTSADDTLVPDDADHITDSSGETWTIGDNDSILRNGVPTSPTGTGSKIFWHSGLIYVLGSDSNWWQWTGTNWVNVGPTQPS